MGPLDGAKGAPNVTHPSFRDGPFRTPDCNPAPGLGGPRDVAAERRFGRDRRQRRPIRDRNRRRRRRRRHRRVVAKPTRDRPRHHGAARRRVGPTGVGIDWCRDLRRRFGSTHSTGRQRRRRRCDRDLGRRSRRGQGHLRAARECGRHNPMDGERCGGVHGGELPAGAATRARRRQRRDHHLGRRSSFAEWVGHLRTARRRKR